MCAIVEERDRLRTRNIKNATIAIYGCQEKRCPLRKGNKFCSHAQQQQKAKKKLRVLNLDFIFNSFKNRSQDCKKLISKTSFQKLISVFRMLLVQM